MFVLFFHFQCLSLGSFISGGADSDSPPANMKTNSQKKVDLEQNSAFNMYDIMFTDLIETFVLPNTSIC